MNLKLTVWYRKNLPLLMMHSRFQLRSVVKVSFLVISHFGHCTWFWVKLKNYQGWLLIKLTSILNTLPVMSVLHKENDQLKVEIQISVSNRKTNKIALFLLCNIFFLVCDKRMAAVHMYHEIAVLRSHTPLYTSRGMISVLSLMK